jgi:hypothetical protein
LGPKEFDKNAFLHPQKVKLGNKSYYALFHRLQTDIQVALASSIEEFKDPDFWNNEIKNRNNRTFIKPLFTWEGVGVSNNWPGQIAGGSPPLPIYYHKIQHRYLSPKELDENSVQTNNDIEQHWLLFYNGSGAPRKGKIPADRQVGALIYKISDSPKGTDLPFEIISRANKPILEPVLPMDKVSKNGNVVFVTGSLISDDNNYIDLFCGNGDFLVTKTRFNLMDTLNYLQSFDANGNRKKY